MAKLSRPRKGSLQFYPRKRIDKFLPSVNWSLINSSKPSVLGFIAYKAGMATALVKDMTEHSMTKNKPVYIPVTILEVPPMKIFSVRFYKHKHVLREVIVSHDKELKRKLKLPKEHKTLEGNIPEQYDDVKVIVYSLPKQAEIKKTPDLIEIAVAGKNTHEKLEFIKSHIGKEITLDSLMASESKLFDIRGLTKGKGLVGPVKRFGLTLKAHKSEKGRRRPGSLGPWHPPRVTYLAPMAGQMGLFTRVHYNFIPITHGKISEKDINPISGFKHYGKVNSSYIIFKGSVQGPPFRQILLTASFRPTKHQLKKKYEFLGLQQ